MLNTLAGFTNRLLAPMNVALVRRSGLRAMHGELDRLKQALLKHAQQETINDQERKERELSTQPSYVKGTLPEGAAEYLRADHPRLVELRARYRECVRLPHSQWGESILAGELNLPYFRGDNAYVWQMRSGMREQRYLLTSYHVKETDRLGLWDRLHEDGLFGAYVFDFNGQKAVSRDLLDSMNEMNFIDRHTGLFRRAEVSVLDIGAGYGRFAHRLIQGLPNVRHVSCTDAVAESTFLSEFYLRFRGVDDRAKVVPFDEVPRELRGRRFDLVTNIQSFSECTLEFIDSWLDVISQNDVEYLFIVPNTQEGMFSIELDHTRKDFLPLITSRGFKVAVSDFLYAGAPSLQKFGVSAHGRYWLFKRRR